MTYKITKIDTLCALVLSGCFLFEGCTSFSNIDRDEPFVVVLGIAQDGGLPHAGCKKICCTSGLKRNVACLAIVDPKTSERWIIDATPDFADQLRELDKIAPAKGHGITGILLTHAHIGHYTGLMHLGREVMGVKRVPVYVMPRMYEFISRNGPWDQLVKLENISLQKLSDQTAIKLNSRISVTPFLVPHRDEYSETVGFKIDGPKKSVLFIPDIDKWEKWKTKIEDMIALVDVAYLDGTFYADGEIPNRSMSEIPHPFIIESMKRFASLPSDQKSKIRFIHLNHTNPAIITGSSARKETEAAGFRIADELEKVMLGRN